MHDRRDGKVKHSIRACYRRRTEGWRRGLRGWFIVLRDLTIEEARFELRWLRARGGPLRYKIRRSARFTPTRSFL
jgi:hypothetical protein